MDLLHEGSALELVAGTAVRGAGDDRDRLPGPLVVRDGP
jgi:hypothetical protein